MENNAKEEIDAICLRFIKNEFGELVNQNYQAVKARGLINSKTDFFDFMEKLEEESQELAAEIVKSEGTINDNVHAELIDCISVLLNMAKHYDIDVIEGLKANIEKNWSRAQHININEL